MQEPFTGRPVDQVLNPHRTRCCALHWPAAACSRRNQGAIKAAITGKAATNVKTKLDNLVKQVGGYCRWRLRAMQCKCSAVSCTYVGTG